MTTAEVPEPTPNDVPETGAPLGWPQKELLGLLVALMALGYLLAATLTAYDLASQNDDAGFGVYGGVDSGLDLEAFLFSAASAMSFQIAVLLVIALVLGSGRRYPDASRSAHVLTWILFPLGIVVSLGAAYTAMKYLTLPEESDGPGMSLGVRSSSRFGPVLSYVSAAAGSMYVAWCAFRRLPIAVSTDPSDGADVDEPDEPTGPAEPVDPERRSAYPVVESDAVVDAEEA